MEKKCMREFDSILIRIVLANYIWVLSYIFSELRAVPCGRLVVGNPIGSALQIAQEKG